MIRIVTVKPDAPYTLADDEVILEKRTSYGEAVEWHLLIQTGVTPSQDATARLAWDAARDAHRDADYKRLRESFAAGLVAFASSLIDAPETPEPAMWGDSPTS